MEDRKHGYPRISGLQAIPAEVRFLSIVPLLEDLGTIPLDGISWVIAGGESGPGARPMKEEWVVSIREQCKAADVPFFFERWGGIRKKKAGRMLMGKAYDEFPIRVQHPTPPVSIRSRQAVEIDNGDLVQLRTA